MAAHTIKTKVAEVSRRVLSTREAMAYLDCSADTLEELRSEQEITYYKYRNRVWYDLKSIDQFLKLMNRPIKPRYHGDIELIARDMNVHRDTVSAALSGVRRSKLAEAIREKAVNLEK